MMRTLWIAVLFAVGTEWRQENRLPIDLHAP